MKKLTLIFLTCLFSICCMADTNYNNSTSELEITDLKVDGAKSFCKARVHLDFISGIFTVTEAKPLSDCSESEPFRSNGYAFTSLGCSRTGTEEVTCSLQIVNEKKTGS